MPPTLVLVVGTAGSGKSTVARQLARQLGAAYLDKDTLATPFTEAILAAAGEEAGARDGSEVYRQQIMPLEYQVLLDVAADVTSVGTSAVLDAPFGAYFDDAAFLTRSLAERDCHAQPVVVRVSAGKDTTRERLVARGSERDAWKLAHWDDFWDSQQVPAWTGVRHLAYANDDDLDLTALVAAVQA